MGKLDWTRFVDVVGKKMSQDILSTLFPDLILCNREKSGEIEQRCCMLPVFR